jgi:hypothetical protein
MLPAGLLVVESSGAGSDLRATVAASAGITVQRAGMGGPQAFDAYQRQAQALVAPVMGPYVDGGSARISAGPYHIATVNSGAPVPPLDTIQVDVTYVADLAARVDVREGLLARPSASGGELTVSMPVSMADRTGVRLFDLVCIGSPSQAASWCARVTGLWRATADADPEWTARGARVQLFTERDELFALIGQQPPRVTRASRQYRPRAAAIAPPDVAVVQARLGDLRAAAGAAGAGSVSTALDADLQRYATSRRVASFPLRLLIVALIPLSALLVVVLTRWYVESRLRDLALLRARGWPRSRVRALVLVELGVVGVSTLAVAVAGLLLVALLAGGGTIAVGPLLPNQLDPLGVGAAAAIPAVTAVVWCGWLAGWASEQSVLRLDHPEARTSRVLSWPVAENGGLLVVPAALLLLIPRVVGTERWLSSGTLADLAALVLSVAGLTLLTVAALPAMSLLAEAPGRSHVEVEWTLAQWRLRRWWQRHAAAGFLLVFAFAVATFAAIAFAGHELNRMGSLGQGDAGGLAIGFASSLVVALLAYGLVFLFAARARSDDYAALVVDGVTVRTVRRSLAIEQHMVLLLGVAAGLVLGVVVAVATSAGVGLGGTAGTLGGGNTLLAALTGLIATAVLGASAGALVARTVRRRMVAFRLFELGQRAS